MRRRGADKVSSSRYGWLIAALAVLLVYGTLDARMTLGDLLFFWGPKARHFYLERSIDIELLKFPHYYLMHPDYPPLLPMAWAGNAVLSGGFTWWGPLLWTAIVLVAAALVLRGYATPIIGGDGALFAALLLAATTYTAAVGRAAGGADPPLVFFVALALSALTFSDHREGDAVAAAALAGAAFTKVEGSLFVITVVIALLLLRRFRTAAVVAIPAALLVGSWILFARHHGILDAYGRSDRAFHVHNLGLVLSIAGQKLSYGAFYLPWIAAALPLLFARSLRRAALPLLVAAGSFTYSLLFYLNEEEPTFWILSSVERTMMTPLTALVVASAAASEYSRRRDGVVPQGEETEGSGRENDLDAGRPLGQV
jgi:hypothetical protein